MKLGIKSLRVKALDIRSVLRRLVAEDATPVRLGVAVGVGVLFACTPFYGLQVVLALLVAWPLRLNKIAVALGTQLSIPPLFPFIAFASISIGGLILHGKLLPVTRAQISNTPARELVRQLGPAWVVGGLVLGLAAGTLIGVMVTLLAKRARAGSAIAAEIGEGD